MANSHRSFNRYDDLLRLYNYISPDNIFHTIISNASWEMDLLCISIYLVLLFSSNGFTLFIDCNHEIHLHCPYLEGKIVRRRTNSTNFLAGKHHLPDIHIHCNDTVVDLCWQQLSSSLWSQKLFRKRIFCFVLLQREKILVLWHIWQQ